MITKSDWRLKLHISFSKRFTIECLASVAQVLPENSVPTSCSVSDLEFLNILYISEKKRKPLVKDIKKKSVFLQCTAIALKPKKKPTILNFN